MWQLNRTFAFILTGWLMSAGPFLLPPTLARFAKDEKPVLKEFGSSLKEFEKKDRASTTGREPPKALPADGLISVETNLVVANVLVLDQKGNMIRDMRAADFVITENGIPQHVDVFSYGERSAIPRSLVLIIDYSGSLFPYLSRSIRAAKLLVDKLGPLDRMAIVTDDVKLLTHFTNDKELLKGKLGSLVWRGQDADARSGYSRGHSLQYSALLATLRELFDSEDLAPIVVFQTDGDELSVLKPAAGGLKAYERPFGFEDVRNAVERSRATIFPIIPGSRLIGLTGGSYKKSVDTFRKRYPTAVVADLALPTVTRYQEALAELAAVSGGYTAFLDSETDAERVYSKLLAELWHRYLIGYYSDAPNDGRRRSVKVEVRGHPEYVVIGRKTYVPR